MYVLRLQHLVLLLFTLTCFAGVAAGSADQRPVVSGSLASDEVLVALFSGDPKAGIVLSHFADDPAHSNITGEAKRFPLRWHNSAEALVALKPHLVILASYNNPALKARLAQAKLKVIELHNFNSLADIRANILAVGRSVGRVKESEALINDMDARLIAVAGQAPAKKPRVLSYSAAATPGGKGTLIDEVITSAGGINLAAEAGINGWAKINAEVLAAMQPEIVLVTQGPTPRNEVISAIRQDPLWKNMQAVKEERFVFVDQPALYSVSHHIVAAIETLSRAFTAPPATAAGTK